MVMIHADYISKDYGLTNLVHIPQIAAECSALSFVYTIV